MVAVSVPVQRKSSEKVQVEALAARLRDAVRAAGGNTAVSERSGIPLRSLNNYLSADAEPKGTTLARIADACAVSVDALLGRDPKLVNASSGIPEGFVFVPLLDVRAAAGSGREIGPHDLFHRDEFGLSEAWLRQLGVSSPRNVHFIRAVGDSMEDTIRDGDFLLVDRNIDRVLDNGIYVVVLGGLIMVKRLQVLRDGSLVLISDNPKFGRETVPADQVYDLQIEGRIRWFGRTI